MAELVASTEVGSAPKAAQCTQHDARDDGQAAAAAPVVPPSLLWPITALGTLLSPLPR